MMQALYRTLDTVLDVLAEAHLAAGTSLDLVVKHRWL